MVLRVGTSKTPQTKTTSAVPGQRNSTLLPEMFRPRRYPRMIAAVQLFDMNYEVKWFTTKITLSTDWLTAYSSVIYQRVTPYSIVFYQLRESIENFPFLSS